ncbi:MAG: DapH/DapD/GlmU-related protein [Prevotellaceae bacterium]|nr:DapH/DapD/GlmU-related protein [Prevotellaceae bacterium]
MGNNCWIGTRCIILPGVEIGDNCIVGSGAVVTRSFPANSIIGVGTCKIT